MKERTKEIVKDGFGSLISNSAALRGAKNGPLWLTIVMFILAVLLPVIPLLVAQLTTDGSSFLKTYSYGLERYVTSMAMDLKNTRLAEFSIDENHLLSVKENGAEVDFNNYGANTPYAAYENQNTHQYDFLLYLSSASTSKEKEIVYKAIVATTYVSGTTNVGAGEGQSVYHPSYMILFKNGVYVSIYGSASATKAVAGSYFGDFNTIKTNDHCLETLLTVTNKDGTAVAQNLYNNEYVNGVLKNFKKFINASYDTLKVKNTWATVGIYAGIFFGLNIVMGLIMWVLTRGKKNPNNYFSIWLTIKVQARMALAPAIITAIAGIFLNSMVPVIYIMTIGLRVMWISMKELRPIQA